MVKLGAYLQLLLRVKNVDQAISYYEQLGFRKLGHDVVTDGSVNIKLASGAFNSPTFHYLDSDIQAIKQMFSPNKRKEKTGHATQAEFKSPSGLRIMLDRDTSPVAMPRGTPGSRSAISKLGQFGEFTIPVKDLKDDLLFWTKLGFEPLHMAEIPYRYALLSDGLIVIGLHENHPQRDCTLTYFAADMPQRIQQLQQQGFDIHALHKNANVTESAILTTRDGQLFQLLHGSV